METKDQPPMHRCQKLLDLPPIVADWQQQAWRPDCDYYDCGTCANAGWMDDHVVCPFDGKEMPLREVTDDTPHDEPRTMLDFGLCQAPGSRTQSEELELTVKDRIMHRTRGRLRSLVIEVIDHELIVRGVAPCYHVKQLALQGVLEGLRSHQEVKVRLNAQVVVSQPGAKD